MIGRPVQVVWNVGGEQTTLEATIERVGAQISQATRGVDIYATLEGKIPSNLRGGAFVEVELTAQPVDGVMALPKDALYTDNRVYLVRNGRLEPRTLVDFVDDGAQVLLKSGLAVGDVVLLTRFNEAAPAWPSRSWNNPDEPDHACCSAFCGTGTRQISCFSPMIMLGFFGLTNLNIQFFPTTKSKL